MLKDNTGEDEAPHGADGIVIAALAAALFEKGDEWCVREGASHFEWVKNCCRFRERVSGAASAIRSMFFLRPACIRPQVYCCAFSETSCR
jgi:hypothetical protein